MKPRTWAPWLGLLALAVGALPASRHVLEASMWRHMVLQYPLWIAAGALCALALPERARCAIAACNVKGVAGLAYITIALAVLMVPRVLDLALVIPAVEVIKLAALFLIGAAALLSWRAAGVVLQSFFFGGVLGMTATVGMLYTESPLRLCNAYLLDDQERLGTWLTTAASIAGVVWFCWIVWMVMRRENAYFEALPESPVSPAPKHVRG